MIKSHDQLIHEKYTGILHRSFKTKLDLFLFNQCIAGTMSNEISIEIFNAFDITDDLIEIYQQAWQLAPGKKLPGNKLSVTEIDHSILEWEKNNPSLKSTLLSGYENHFKAIVFPFETFKEFYGNNSAERECHYCELSEMEFKFLRHQKGIYTKRVRGYEMEIDRLNSNREYTRENVVICCYFCNNAKTDEFTHEEFKQIASPGIKQVWFHRINLRLDNPIKSEEIPIEEIELKVDCNAKAWERIKKLPREKDELE
jgi:hypothetical protein